MTHEEIQILYEKVVKVIYNYESYHVYYTYGDEWWHPNGLMVTFEVYGHSDQGKGADWTESWSIDAYGTIHSEDKEWKSFEEFKNDFI